jgi:hypothetical protein
MDPISLILAALVAGAGKGVGEAAATAVKDAYGGLRAGLRRVFAGKPAAEYAVERYTSDPRGWKANLEVELRQAGADHDRALLEAAQLLMAHADPAGANAGKYSVNLAGAQGVQVGDHNTQSNDFRTGA